MPGVARSRRGRAPRGLLPAGGATALALLALLIATATPVAASTSFPGPAWVLTVGQVALSSPTVATIDGVSALVFGSENGELYVVNAATHMPLPGWPQPVDLGGSNASAVESSPTVAYLDGPRQPPTILVGAGSTYVSNQQGGLEAFNANGSVRFVFHTKDVFNEWTGAANPSGYDNAVFSTPAVGDLTGSGQQDIVFGSWDHEIYALTPSGSLVPGFPIDNQDTVWSSPALYHVRGAGSNEDLFVGGDASGRDGCYGGWVMDFHYAHDAPHLRWEHCEDQTIWSSPAIGPIDGSGRPAVVVGTGFGEKPPYKPGTDRVYAFWAGTGRAVPGWPVPTDGPVFGSPAIGVLPGSPTPSVVDTSWCVSCTTYPQGASKVYAWSGSGHLEWSQELLGGEDFASPVLADLTGSGQNDVIVGSSAGLFPLAGASGSFLFGTSATSAINNCSVQNSPVVADVAGAWHLFETCGGPRQLTAIGRVFDYPLPAAPGVAPPWPMWRGGPAHDGVGPLTPGSSGATLRSATRSTSHAKHHPAIKRRARRLR